MRSMTTLLLILAESLLSARDLTVLRRFIRRDHARRQCALCLAYVQHIGTHVRRDHADLLAHPAY